MSYVMGEFKPLPNQYVTPKMCACCLLPVIHAQLVQYSLRQSQTCINKAGWTSDLKAISVKYNLPCIITDGNN